MYVVLGCIPRESECGETLPGYEDFWVEGLAESEDEAALFCQRMNAASGEFALASYSWSGPHGVGEETL